MNKDNNNLTNKQQNNENNNFKKIAPSDKTRSFTNTSRFLSDNANIVVDTDINIKKAKVKRVVKKGVGGTFFFTKKAFQWVLNVLLTLFLVGTICAVIVGGTFYIYMQNYLVDNDFDILPSELRNDLSQTSWVYYDEKYGDEYAPIELYGTENRSWVYYDEIPQNLVNAFVAIEDERYWEHNGVDWKRTFGAAASFITGSDDYGGSTITQQLIKNVTGDDETTIQRKITEIFKALSLSGKRSKEEVLEMYLNRIHLSRSNYGVWAAAKYYFGKDMLDPSPENQLTACECAALASIPKSPTKYDPVRNPDENKKRRKLVLDKMLEHGTISKEEHEQAVNEELQLRITYEQTQVQGTYSYFTDALIEQLIKDLAVECGYTRSEALNLIYTGGLSIYSTENPEIQKTMEEVFNDPATFQKVDDGIQPQSAMVVMDPYTGEVVGIVGGRGEKEGKLDLNRATQSTRQVGSSIKPLTVYAPAMDLGIINYGTCLDDSPIYMENMERYWPSNSPNRYDGHIAVNEAVIRSKNTTAVKLVKDSMGVDYVYDFAKNTLHLDSLVKADKDVAPLALGGFTYGLTVMEMTAAYSIFPNDGYYSTPRLYTKVVRPDGTILLDRRRNKEEYAVSKETAKVMSKILENVVWNGTAARISLKYELDCAGKTGSTNDNKDVYFCGFTPYYVGACWFGYDIPKSLNKFGTNPAMLAWEKVMRAIHKPQFEAAKNGANSTPLKEFDFSKLETASFCLDSGMIPGETCALDPRGERVGLGYYYEGDGAPKKTCTAHIKVQWCPESNMLAGPYCPVRTETALVSDFTRNVDPEKVTVLDAPYIYSAYSSESTCTVHTSLVLPGIDVTIPDHANVDDEAQQDGDNQNFEVNDDDYDSTLDNNEGDSATEETNNAESENNNVQE